MIHKHFLPFVTCFFISLTISLAGQNLFFEVLKSCSCLQMIGRSPPPIVTDNFWREIPSWSSAKDLRLSQDLLGVSLLLPSCSLFCSVLRRVPSLYPATPQPYTHSLPFAFPRPKPELKSVGHLWPTDSASFWLNTSPLVGMGFDFALTILLWLLVCPWTGAFFLVGFQHHPMDGHSAASSSLGVLAEKVSTSSAPPSWLMSILSRSSISIPQDLRCFLRFAACVGAGGLSALGRQWVEGAERREAGRGLRRAGVERVHTVTASRFPIHMYECDRQTIKRLRGE